MKQIPSPNFNERAHGIAPAYIILHYTDMQDAASAIARLCDPLAEVSAHYVIDEDGRMTAEAGPYAGLDRFEARKRVLADLERLDLLEKTEAYAIAITEESSNTDRFCAAAVCFRSSQCRRISCAEGRLRGGIFAALRRNAFHSLRSPATLSGGAFTTSATCAAVCSSPSKS